MTLEYAPECKLSVDLEMAQRLQIGQVAREKGLSVDAVRFLKSNNSLTALHEQREAVVDPIFWTKKDPFLR